MSLATRDVIEDLSTPSERISRIRGELLATTYSICLERPGLLTEFRRSPEGRAARCEHPLVRRAMALAYLMSNRLPHVYADELIVGNMTSRRIAANYYVEGGSVNILEDIWRLEKKATSIHMSGREKMSLVILGLENLLRSVAGKALLRPGRIKHFLDFFMARRYFITEEAGIAHQVGDYNMVVHQGLQKSYDEAGLRLESGRLADGSPLSDDNRAFFRSVRITIDGIRKMAANLASAAEREAAKPGVPAGRRAELLEAAAACRHVPYEPARTFIEGLQSIWLVHVALNLEDFEQGLSFGRLDQILYPLFLADLDEGRLTASGAAELLASFGLKTCETMPLYSERVDQFFSGNGVAQAITVGGTDGDGNDVTNELSSIILDSYAQIRTREPALHVRIHPGSPPWLMEKAVEVIQLGTSRPSLFGDTSVVKALEGAGMSAEHARDYAVIGCVEMASQGRTYNSSDAALFNLPLCLELALNEGRRFPGKGHAERRSRMGASTRPVSAMRTFDDVVEAFRTQVADSVNEMIKVINWLEEVYRVERPTPVNSIITDGCLRNGKDVTWGGALYDYTSIQAAGLASAGDSLYAIKRLVFDEKRLALEELVRFLKDDWSGCEALRVEISTKFPGYGNSEPAADAMTQIAADAFSDAIRAHRNSRGGMYIPGFYSMTCHIGFGRVTGALPDGRHAGERLSNGLSPVDGRERGGPTAVLGSAASLDSARWANCYALNLKFDKATVQGARGRDILTGLFNGYFELGGMQVQVNVLDADVLRAARDDPTLYPDLVVRVAGYCVYFNDLQPAVKEEIIERTAHSMG
ncbi:MAG TPA: pyruvate formate lyase family protein [Candidatus Anoxymicrobiaceae bacterium]